MACSRTLYNRAQGSVRMLLQLHHDANAARYSKIMQYKSFIKNRQIKRETFSQGKKSFFRKYIDQLKTIIGVLLSANHRGKSLYYGGIIDHCKSQGKKLLFIGGNIDHSCVNSIVSDRPLAPPPLPLAPVSSACGFAAVGAAVLGLWLHSPLRRLFKVDGPLGGWLSPPGPPP